MRWLRAKSDVYGLGERKVSQFGDAVLEVVRTFSVG